MANFPELSLPAVNNGNENAILVSKLPLFEFDKNGNRTTENPLGVRVGVILQCNRMSPLTAKILGADPLPNISDEDIAAACAACKFPFVKLIECKIKVYNMNGSIGMTATASGVELVNSGK